jgi:hypothetical protein
VQAEEAHRAAVSARELALAALPPAAALLDGSGGAAEARRAAKAMLRLAQLCDEALAANEPGPPAAAWAAVIAAAGGPDGAAFILAENVLRACALAGSRLPAARAALPRVLSLLSGSPRARTAFAEHGAALPLFFLLPWAPEMLAGLGGEEGDVLLPPLRTLAAVFPRALCTPVRLAVSDGNGSLAGQRAQSLVPLACSAATDAFSAACSFLTFPHKRLEHHFNELSRYTGDVEALRNAVRLVAADVADPAAARAAGAGRLNCLFAELAKTEFDRTLGPDYALLSLKALEKLRDACSTLLARPCPEWRRYVDEVQQLTKMNDAPLHAFSAFLAGDGLSAGFADDWIEMPGQYATACACGLPLDPKRHVRILGCAPTLSVMSSKELPVAITLLGDDGRQVKFLCKGGDDLRQDERIMRFFRACNEAMQSHSPSNARSLAIPTYHVEALSQRLGLVSWIPRAEPLHAVLKRHLPPGSDDACFAMFNDFVAAKAGGQDTKDYIALVLSESNSLPADCEAKLRELHARLGNFALRDALLRHAGSPEAFLAARSRFLSSLIAGAAGCYVAGVADRHPGNIMLDDSGTLFQIDFGYSFSQGALLPVPELLPLRLTRALTEAVAPVDVSGLLQADMAVALQALHLARAPLLAALDVFVRQPLLAWEQTARSVFRNAPDAPARLISLRMTSVRSKLSLCDPTAVLLKELAPKYPGQDQQRALEALLVGDSARGCARTEGCKRSRRTGGAMSAREQAECLIDMCADANILMRSWRGLRPWL